MSGRVGNIGRLYPLLWPNCPIPPTACQHTGHPSHSPDLSPSPPVQTAVWSPRGATGWLRRSGGSFLPPTARIFGWLAGSSPCPCTRNTRAPWHGSSAAASAGASQRGSSLCCQCCSPCRASLAPRWRFETVLRFTASVWVTWCLFHQGGPPRFVNPRIGSKPLRFSI
jgi:hypothetical protein